MEGHDKPGAAREIQAKFIGQESNLVESSHGLEVWCLWEVDSSGFCNQAMYTSSLL